MNGRRVALGLCMACALLVSAVAASGAQAVEAVTCSPSAAKKEWAGAHCNGTAGSSFGHETFTNSPKTKLVGAPGTAFEGVQRLRATINGINTELVTSSVTGNGELEENGPTTVKGSGTIEYTGVTVAAPAGKGCIVSEDGGAGTEGKVVTNPLKASTTKKEELVFTPASGEVFAAFVISGCKGSEALEGLNKTYTVTGSVKGVPDGGETVATHATVTSDNTLKLNNAIKAGLNGGLTIKREGGNALALT
jgi:opacity protein-like surface antigen